MDEGKDARQAGRAKVDVWSPPPSGMRMLPPLHASFVSLQLWFEPWFGIGDPAVPGGGLADGALTMGERSETPSSGCTRSTDEISTNGFSSSNWPETNFRRRSAAAATCLREGGGGLGIQLAVGPQPLWLRNHNSGHAQRIMVKRLATSPHDPLGITDSSCKNQSVMVSVQYGPFNPYIPIRSTTIGKSRVAIDPIAMRTSWRSNSDIASATSIGYPRMSASGESSTTMHRLLHASGSYPIPTPHDPKTKQYNKDLGLIHSTNGNHLENPKEGSSIDHQVTIYLHAQNITMFPVRPRALNRSKTPSSGYTRSADEISTNGFSSSNWPETNFRRRSEAAAAACLREGGGGLAVGLQPLWLRNHNSGPTQRIMVKRLATSPHDPLGITDSACKNQSVVVSVQYGPFNPYIPIRSTTIDKSRVAIDPIAMRTSSRSNSDIASATRFELKVSELEKFRIRIGKVLIKLATGSCDWLSTQRASAESLAREQNAVVSTYVNDIVLLSLSPNIICWLHSSLRLDFLLYDVASLLRLDVQATCWYLETAGLKPSADYSTRPVPQNPPSLQQPSFIFEGGSSGRKDSRFRPKVKQFKKSNSSSSSSSGQRKYGSSQRSSESGAYCGKYGGRHATDQCRGVSGICNVCRQPGHYAKVCSQRATAASNSRSVPQVERQSVHSFHPQQQTKPG
ncbi:Copia-like retrotransposable element [Dorcoceras hygrometricum]|uniref:Copia-like retrotransposable element n=1 Tax=Dorcoceras hygrometricum TaxID=472368 RepID=A0A2Z7B428_9LAMI|nr:Copia-like retrotransposable element [Dorcoceras hygrometricum]